MSVTGFATWLFFSFRVIISFVVKKLLEIVLMYLKNIKLSSLWIYLLIGTKISEKMSTYLEVRFAYFNYKFNQNLIPLFQRKNKFC